MTKFQETTLFSIVGLCCVAGAVLLGWMQLQYESLEGLASTTDIEEIAFSDAASQPVPRVGTTSEISVVTKVVCPPNHTDYNIADLDLFFCAPLWLGDIIISPTTNPSSHSGDITHVTFANDDDVQISVATKDFLLDDAAQGRNFPYQLFDAGTVTEISFNDAFLVAGTKLKRVSSQRYQLYYEVPQQDGGIVHVHDFVYVGKEKIARFSISGMRFDESLRGLQTSITMQ